VYPLNSIDDEIRARLDAKRYAEAFELVLTQYQHKVFRLAYSMLGSRTLAEEVAQDIFLRVWRALPGFRGMSSVSTWIFSVARNACLTALKSSAKRRALSLDEPGVRMAAEARHVPPREAAGAPDLAHLVAQLPEKYRQVITLFYMEEKSYEQVARQLDLPMGTVKTYLHRARGELAMALSRNKMREGER
jgi:RNA polymerase sigma-70 factor, ECF subfamily